nr:hypothetical protein [uncultured bacterium]
MCKKNVAARGYLCSRMSVDINKDIGGYDDRDRSSRTVATWLLIGVFMITIQVLLGGITRLTGSGLSITEWKPIMGALPPMNEQDWKTSFEKYKQIAQYKYLNTHFTLEDFKFIFSGNGSIVFGPGLSALCS